MFSLLSHDQIFLMETLLWPPPALEIKSEPVRLCVIWPPSPTSSVNPMRAGTRGGHNVCNSSLNSWADRDDQAQPPAFAQCACFARLAWPGGKDLHFPYRSSELRMGSCRSLPSPYFLECGRHTGIINPPPPALSGSDGLKGL